MAEKKQHKIVSADTGEEVKPGAKPKPKPAVQAAAEAQEPVEHSYKPAKEVGNAKGLRIGAICLWVAAIIFEVLAVLVLFGKIHLTFMPVIWQLIVFIVLDLACLIIGSQLWKKANRIDPASKANPTKFWLWNNLGVIVAVAAFCPLLILLLTNKDLDKRTKAICTVLAAIALMVGGLTGYDFNPISSEELDAAVEVLGDEQVYWAPFGKVYHTHEDCSSLNQSETLTVGTVEQAVAANRTRLCYFCAQQDNIDTTNLLTDGGE